MDKKMKKVVSGSDGVGVGRGGIPHPERNQILVRVSAVGLNRVDLLTAEAARRGADEGGVFDLGRDFSGFVVKTGEDVTAFKPGDAVMGSGKATLAEYAVTDKDLATHVPRDALSMEEAAVLPVALNTMHDALLTRGRLAPGQSVLVQGASSGVGLMALQIAKYIGAMPVIGTSRTESRRKKLAAYGADIELDSSDPSWVEKILDATGRMGVNLVIDQVGASAANDNMRASSMEGRIINVGRLGGNTGIFNFDLHAYKRITYIGVTFRTRTLEEVRQIVRNRQIDLAGAIAEGRLKLPIDRVFPLEQIEKALSRMSQNQHFGKIVVKI